MKFYIHHLYLLLALVALIVCMCFPLIQFMYTDFPVTDMTNFKLLMDDGTSASSTWALGVLLICSWLVTAFAILVSTFQNFALQKRSTILNTCLLAGYYIIFLVLVLVMRDGASFVQLKWPVCLPLVALILTVMSFFSIRRTEAKKLASANTFRLRD